MTLSASLQVTRAVVPDRRHDQAQKLQKQQIGTAECKGHVLGINLVVNCMCKVLLRQEIHLTLADAKVLAETDEDNVVGKKRRLTDTVNTETVYCSKHCQTTVCKSQKQPRFILLVAGWDPL